MLADKHKPNKFICKTEEKELKKRKEKLKNEGEKKKTKFLFTAVNTAIAVFILSEYTLFFDLALPILL